MDAREFAGMENQEVGSTANYEQVFWASLDVSDIYLRGANGDPTYAGVEALDDFVYEGVEADGFWARAWARAFGDKGRAEENFQEVVLAAIEVVAEKPEITEQEPGYLLQAAAWRARNTYARRNHTYLKKTHGYTSVSLDNEAFLNDGTADHHEEIAAPTTVDHDLILSVRQQVERIEDDRLYEVATLLMEGYTKSRVSQILGVTPAAVTYYVKKLQVELGAILA